MCGIAGFYSFLNQFDKRDLEIMTSEISHRGPDSEGYFFNGKVGLGHRRLSIIDLSSAANQPMCSANGRYVIIFNGEIYNFRELAKQENFSLKTNSDTEVLLEGFAKNGPSFVNKLNGMFAFAIYDKEDDCLFVFRDRIGIKPVYYYWSSPNFAFASETKSLLKLDIDRTINELALMDYLFLEYIPSYQSIFKNIKKLENGHYLKVSSSGLTIHKYYDFIDHYKPFENYKEAQLLDLFSTHLSESIKLQSVSDVPLGAFLSGGTDSSLICSIFQSQNKAPINTFTIGFDVKEYDERYYAEKVATILKTQHHVEVVSENQAQESIKSLIHFYDEPFAVSSAIPSLQVCKTAKDFVTVALSGDGGDELFMGYGYYNWYNRVDRINKLGGYRARKIVSTILSHIPGNTYKRAGRVFDIQDYGRMWMHIWSQEQYMFSENEISQLLGKKYEHQTTLKSWEKINQMDIHPFQKISFFDLKNYLPYNLLYKMDIASMAYGLEVRVPYLDHNLLEFAINVPVDFKIKHGERKYLMKKLLERYLPNDLVYRKKWGFPAPIDNWLKNDFSSMIDQYLDAKSLERQGIFNSDFVQKLVKEFRNGRVFHCKRIWALLIFQFWYKYYIEKEEVRFQSKMK